VRQIAPQAILDDSPLSSRESWRSLAAAGAEGGVIATAPRGIMQTVFHGREARRPRAARIVAIAARQSPRRRLAEPNIQGGSQP